MIEDEEFFLAEMRDVRPIPPSDRADTGRMEKNRDLLRRRRHNAASVGVEPSAYQGPSDLFVMDVESDQQLAWRQAGVQERQMRRLQAGEIPFEGDLDLHGMKVEQARELLWELIGQAVRREVRCVRVTHGKSQRRDGKAPLLKSHVNTWLRQHPMVLAFCSCQPRHGGTGAVYVLIRRQMLDGRDE